MKKQESEVVAVIDVGTNHLRMSIASIFENGEIEILDEVYKPTTIGRDTFANSRISPETIEDTCEVIKGFSRLMKDYKVKNYKAIATSGLREADNRDYIIEQIRLISGINVEIINIVQERYFIYKALRNHSIKSEKINFNDTLIINISSGGVEASIYDDTGLKFTEYFKLGPLRLREILCELENKTIQFPKVMEEYIESKIFVLKSKIKNMKIKKFIGLGGDLSTILSLYNISNDSFIENDKIDKLYAKIKSMNSDQIANFYKISIDTAELMLPAVLIFHSFLSLTNANGIYAPMISLRQGMLYDLADEMFDLPRKNVALNDIVSSVWYIAEKYGVEKNHAAYVEKMSLEIFDKTWKWHHLGDREKLYLQVASILHDTGNYVNFSEHGMHSYNIIRTQNIMGFSDKEIELIANVARYHTSKIPTYGDNNYNSLRHKEKITVSKLSAILKVAESMDSSHLQRINKIETNVQNDILYIKLHSDNDNEVLLEKWDIMNNVAFFQEVMGIKIKLKG
jgi:exopolyphosphatase / guanosine-5'-triphosphate,3'-diphosphate pyrophosphatase